MPVVQVPVDQDLRPNTAPGKAVRIAELGHGSVWIQYRRHEHKSDDQLTFYELVARTHDLGLDKLPEDFGRIMEQEIALSDIAVRIKTVEEAAQMMFQTYIENFEYTRRAGPP